MTIDKTTITILLILAFVTAIPAALFFRKIPAVELSPSEVELIRFSSTPVALSAPKQQPVFSGLDCPVKAVTKQDIASTNMTKVGGKSVPPLKFPDLNRAKTDSKKVQPGSLSSLPAVSMIYTEGDTNRAIIGGQILHEGSSFGHYQVVKIERTRVLIRSAGKNVWLSME